MDYLRAKKMKEEIINFLILFLISFVLVIAFFGEDEPPEMINTADYRYWVSQQCQKPASQEIEKACKSYYGE